MKLGRGSILTLLLAGWLCLTPVVPAPAQGPGVPNLPALLEFDRRNCPICRASEMAILAVKDQYPGTFVVRKLYIDTDEYLFRRYKVVIVPTQVFLDTTGEEIYRHEGVFKPEDLIRRLRELKIIGD